MFADGNEGVVADVLLIRHSWRRRNDRIEAQHVLICGEMGSMRRVFALLLRKRTINTPPAPRAVENCACFETHTKT